MATHLNILIVEDSADDAELVAAELQFAGFEPKWKRVETEVDYRASLEELPDLIISDFTMPQFGGLRAMDLLRERGLDIPFILVSGTVGEEMAVEAMKHGVTDYLLKDRMGRLGNAVERALEQKRLRNERGRMQQQLALQATALETTANGIMITDRAGTILWANPAFTIVTGYLATEVIGKTPRILKSGKHDQTFYQDFWQTITTGKAWRGEFINQRKNGSIYYTEQTVNAVHSQSGMITHFIGIMNDVTERKQVESALRESEEKFRQLAENINEVFWITDPAKKQMLYISPAYEKIWGRTCDSIYQSPQSWLEAVHPEDRQRILEAATKQQHGGYDETYRIVRPDGSVRWIRDRGFPVQNAAGKVFRIVGTAEDISERKKLEAQFLRAQRMEGIGTLAGGIAHDLNNVLVPILMSCDLLQTQARDEDSRKLVGLIKGSAERGAELVKQVLSFARGVEGRRISVQPKHLIREMVDIGRRTFPKSIHIQAHMPRTLWTVSADPTQLHQVLLNLCVNARDAMPAGGEITITAENVMVDGDLPGMDQDAKKGRYIVLKVTDTGTGIPPEIRERIFNPFFTTKEIGKGTGLGLSTTLGIVKSHAGFINLCTEPGNGSTFEVWIPAQSAEEMLSPQVPEAQIPRGHGELILLVDDEASVRAIIRQILEAYGYVVLTASNGAEAISLYTQHQCEIGVVLTDILMPVMDGDALELVLRKINPAVRIIATSGRSDSELHSKASSARPKYFLLKPYSSETLLTSLYEILHDPPGST